MYQSPVIMVMMTHECGAEDGIQFDRKKRSISKNRSQDSSVGIATGYGLDDQRGGISSPGRVKNFHFSTSSRQGLRSTQPPIKWVPWALSWE
jgi:hypothetical protein